MKKRVYSIIAIIILAIIICIPAYYIIKDSTPDNPEGEFSNQEILNIILPEINNYCETLDNNVIHSACPTCTSYKNEANESYIYVNDINEEEIDRVHKYTIEKDGENYLVDVKMHLIYGRNDRPGEVILEFELDKNGNIIDMTLPFKGCM